MDDHRLESAPGCRRALCHSSAFKTLQKIRRECASEFGKLCRMPNKGSPSRHKRPAHGRGVRNATLGVLNSCMQIERTSAGDHWDPLRRTSSSPAASPETCLRGVLAAVGPKTSHGSRWSIAPRSESVTEGELIVDCIGRGGQAGTGWKEREKSTSFSLWLSSDRLQLLTIASPCPQSRSPVYACLLTLVKIPTKRPSLRLRVPRRCSTNPSLVTRAF